MKQQSKETVAVLANATALATGIVGQLAGSQIAGTIAGVAATNEALTDLVASHIQNRLTFEANFQRGLTTK